MLSLRRLYSWHFPVLILAAMTAAAQVSPPNPDNRSPAGAPAQSATLPGALEPPATESTISPGVEVTGTTPHSGEPLPTLPPDQFTDCYASNNTAGPEAMDFVAMALCEKQLERDKHVVIEKCLNPKGTNPPAVVIQACTELLDHKVFIGRERYYVHANRAEAYLSLGDRQQALADYNQAVTYAPHNAKLRFNRALFYLGQSSVDEALQDIDAALSLDPKLVAALLQRAKIRRTQKDYSGALADYSEAIRLEPKTAAVWSERGYLYLTQHDYENAVTDEAEAIRLDPKLARAYLFRGTAAGARGDSSGARSDLMTALRLDPSLGRFVTFKGGYPTVAPPP